MAGQWKLRGYVIERLLGAGGTGEVWRARVAATGDTVALKRLVRGEPRHARVEAEAALLSTLEHPNLIRLHGVERDGAAHVLVLDLAEGGSLADLLAVRGRLTPGEVVTALAPVAAALAYAHAQGVVHGDVSAANVLFTASGVPLLADLGVARLVGDDAAAESTPGYVDPAVAVGCVPGPGSDVFMLGGVALHALTGAPPWPGATAAEALAAARAGDLGDVSASLAAAGVPAEMAAIIVRALSSDALDRGGAAELALDLRYSVEPLAVELHAGRTTSRDLVARGARAAMAGNRERGAAGAVAPTRERPRGRHAAPADSDSFRFAATGPGSAPRHAATAGSLPWQPVDGVRAGLPGGPGGPSAVELAGCGGGADPGNPPPTVAVAPRPRPRLPRRRPVSLPSRRVGVGCGVIAVLVVAGVVAATWSTADPASGRRAAATAPPSALPTTVATPGSAAVSTAVAASVPTAASMSESMSESTSVTTSVSTARSTNPPTKAATNPPTKAAAGAGLAPPVGNRASPGLQAWVAALRALDARRAAAFAQRRPALLRDVYAAPRLRQADARLLRRLVPAGCRLVGVRTAFDHVRVSATPGHARIEATASLPASRLICGGRLRAMAQGAGPTRLIVTLVRTRDGPRVRREVSSPAVR